MQALTALFILFLSVGVFAQTTSLPSGGYGFAADPPNPAQACISDICGLPAQSNSYMTKYMDRVFDYNRLSMSSNGFNFPPAVSKIFSEQLAEDDKQNEVLISMFKKSSSLGGAALDGISKGFYNAVYAGPFLKKIKYNTSMVDGKMIATVDEAASTAQLKDLSTEDRIWVLQVAKYYALPSTFGSLSDDTVDSQPAGVLLKMLHPGSSLPEAMKLELSQAQSAMASLKNLSVLEKGIYFNRTSPDRVALIATHVADGTVDENETREIIRWNRSYQTTKNLFVNPNSPLMTRPTPAVEEIITKGGGVDSLAKFLIEDRARERLKDERKIESCKMQYFLNKGLLPSKEQSIQLKQDISRSKQMVQEMIKAKFPSSMQQKLIQAVENTEFVVPPTAADFETNFEASLRQRLEAQRASVTSLSNLSNKDSRQLIPVWALLYRQKDPNSKDDSNGYCDAFKYSPMSDRNYTTYGATVLSFSTATGDETTRLKTVMHELGHSISKAIADDPQASGQISGVRKCLADQHSEDLSLPTKKTSEGIKVVGAKMNETFIEEDFADTVAGQSGRAIKGRNPWCQFMTLNYDRRQYQESKMSANEGDSHSSWLFRLLNSEVMQKGNVPESCKSYYKVAQYTEHFSSCFDLASPQGSTNKPPVRGAH